MAKKLSMVAAAIAVVAFVVPTVASATTLTIGGKIATKGQSLTGTSTNMTWLWPFGEYACEEVELPGTVAAYTEEGTVNAEFGKWSSGGSTSVCFIKPQNEEILISDLTLTKFHSEGNEGTGTASLEYDALFPGELHCHYSGTLPATFVDGSNAIHLEGYGLAGSPGICGENGETYLSADFKLSSIGGQVALNYE